MTAEAGAAKPLSLGPDRPEAATFDNPPGLYGTEDGFTALNLLPADATLRPLLAAQVDHGGKAIGEQRDTFVIRLHAGPAGRAGRELSRADASA